MKKQELFNNVTEGFPYQRQPQQVGLYDAAYEHDACGVGMLVNIHGEKSHDIVESALKVLENMRHRGAEGADNKTGDGAGIMLQIPHEFILLQGIPVPEKGRYGTGLLFLPKNEKDQAAILSIIIEEIEKEGLTLMHLRNVPTCPEILGESALANEPDIKQVFITGFTETETADRKLYLIRKRIENKVRLSSIPAKDDFYVVSLSTKSIIYKGMLSSLQLRNYYPDLTNSYFTSGLALVHSRFSTNTFPTWGLAQPFRLLAHNGEINTIRGNRGWMEARESVLSTPTLLFRMIMGLEEPTGGSFRVGPTVKLAYVDQQHKSIDPEKTVYEVISGGADLIMLGNRQVNARAYVARFNFSGADQEKKCGMLSGGERNRLHLALALKEEGNVLLLDEPTNDIDVNTLRALEEGLENFAGCAVVISHDRWFLDRIATHILSFEGDSKVVFYQGSYSEFEEWKRAQGGDTTPHRVKYKKLME